MKIFITGISGFIGYHLARKLFSQGHHVLGIDSYNSYYDVALKRARSGKLDELGIENSYGDLTVLAFKSDWFNKLEIPVQLIVLREINKALVFYNFSNVKQLGDGICEIKINHRPGLRVYFSRTLNDCFLILLAGHKGTQKRDIIKAKNYWSLYGR